MRGDRPEIGPEDALVEVATPHARGSTPVDECECVYVPGYPACAGIDPRHLTI